MLDGQRRRKLCGPKFRIVDALTAAPFGGTMKYLCAELACKLCAYLRLPVLQAKTPVPMDVSLPQEMQ